MPDLEPGPSSDRPSRRQFRLSRRLATAGVAVAAAAAVLAGSGGSAPLAAQAPGGGGRGAVDAGPGRQGGRGRGGIQIGPGETCPPGTTEVRPQRCQAPEFPPPSIVDYRPRSTLVTETHLVPRARFPVIDIHGHAQNMLRSADGLEGLIAELDELNVRVFVAADNVTGTRLTEELALVANSPYKDRVRILTGIPFGDVEPGFGQRAAREIEAAIQAGAVGLGEVPKSFGLRIQKADGTRLRIDDPELDPVWDLCARLGIPAFIHTAEPQEFFQPLDMQNERWLELSLFRDRRNYGPGRVTFEELITERNNLFRRHPKTTFIAAHFGWHANDLGRAAAMLDEFPNVVVEVGAILYDLGRQPRAAHDFFVKYQDRILFGKDAFEPSEYPYYWRVFETADEYFDYYRNYHAFWKLYGMDLPDEVLRKLYHENALRVVPGLPQAGWSN